MKIYTKTGDRGETSLFGGARVSKDHPRVAAYGEVDELNSFVGSLVSLLHKGDLSLNKKVSTGIQEFLQTMQHRLFDLGAELAATDPKFVEKLPRRITEQDVAILEGSIDTMTMVLKPLKNFILPGGSSPASAAHICRSVSRRAERAMVAAGDTPELLITYINRVSDYFFVLARYFNHITTTAETEWEK